MNQLMATARDAGELVALDGRHRLRIRGMDSAFFEIARSSMAMQAFPVVEGLIKPDGVGRRRDVLLVYVLQSPQLGANSAKKCIVGVAGVTGKLARHAVV